MRIHLARWYHRAVLTSMWRTVLLISLLTLALHGASDAAEVLKVFSSKADFASFTLIRARWDDAAKGLACHGDECAEPKSAIVESPEVPVPAGFDHAIVSWNSTTPPGSCLTAYVQARIDGQWTGWYNMGMWNRDGRPGPRTSLKAQDDDFGKVSTDTLILKKKADAYRTRIELASVDGKTYPTLRLIAVSVTDTSKPPVDKPLKKVWGRELDVPELCQLSVEGGSVWCSPTSTAMVLGYWGKKLKRPELTLGITETAKAVYDEAWRGTGNWVFNTAFAGEFAGIQAYVTRFDGLRGIEEWIARGVPVIVSVDYNKLNRRNTEVGMGHLMVIRGFTKTGNPIFNDPWAHLDKGQTVRKIFDRSALADAWLGANGSHGTVYIIHPEGWGR